MSSFPRAARCFVALALASPVVLLPVVATATTSAKGRVSTSAATGPAATRTVQAQTLAQKAAQKAAQQKAAQQKASRKLALRKNPKVPKRAAIVFEKNWKNPFNSRVHFRVWARQGKQWVPVEASSWRAGSGLGGRAGKDSCHRNVGWLPDGTYSFVQHDRRKAPAINGRVFELEAKACRNGTRRQLLFIHSEQTQFNTQCRNRRGDDRCRWEVPVYNDYKSNGCIKMAPGPLRQLTRHFHRYFKADVHYPRSVVKVRVTG